MSVEDMAARLEASAFSEGLRSVDWLVPLLQSVHILMIGVVFVSILVVALRVLGRVRAEEPLARVWRRFAPFLWSGLAVMAVTGALLTLAEPVREFMALSFRIKMLLLVVGIASAAAFGLSVARAAAAQPPIRPLLRLGSVATVLLWLAIIFLGRAIAYDEAVWGAASPSAAQSAASQ